GDGDQHAHLVQGQWVEHPSSPPIDHNSFLSVAKMRRAVHVMSHRSETGIAAMNAHVTEPKAVDAAALAQLFTQARTHNEFTDRAVPEALLRRAVDLAKMGPTSANQSPMRIVFVKSAEAKAKLLPAMSEG